MFELIKTTGFAFAALFLLALSVTPVAAADVAYTDADGCIHTPILLKSGEAAYWNLDVDTCDSDLFTSMSSRYGGDDEPDKDAR